VGWFGAEADCASGKRRRRPRQSGPPADLMASRRNHITACLRPSAAKREHCGCRRSGGRGMAGRAFS
jgi:hypothetical protein